jgi:hypothetical protein
MQQMLIKSNFKQSSPPLDLFLSSVASPTSRTASPLACQGVQHALASSAERLQECEQILCIDPARIGTNHNFICAINPSEHGEQAELVVGAHKSIASEVCRAVTNHTFQ